MDSSFYNRLARLKLAIDKKSNASMIGSRKSVRKGSSAEFSDFREYMPGDDIRGIDWNAYARLDRLYIKEYMEEKESHVSIFLDTSSSMDYGEKTKFSLMTELAAGLSYISLSNMDHVTIYDMSEGIAPYAASGGTAGMKNLTTVLDRKKSQGKVDMYKSVRSAGRLHPGLTILCSDFLSEEFLPGSDTLAEIIKYLNFMKQKVVLLHIMAGEELEIDLSGTCNLIDMEDEENKIKVTMDEAALREYEKTKNDFLEGLKKTARKHGAEYFLCSTKDSFDKIIFEKLHSLYEW